MIAGRYWIPPIQRWSSTRPIFEPGQATDCDAFRKGNPHEPTDARAHPRNHHRGSETVRNHLRTASRGGLSAGKYVLSAQRCVPEYTGLINSSRVEIQATVQGRHCA